MFPRLREHLRTSVRARLLAIALLPLVLGLPSLLGLVLYWGNAHYDRLLIFKVKSDLAVADQYFRRALDRVGLDTQGVAQSHALVNLLDAREWGAAETDPPPARPGGRNEKTGEELRRLLAWKAAELNLDFLVYHPGNAPSPAEETWEVARRAWAGETSTAIDIYSAEQLARIRPELARRARLDLVSTLNARPTDKRVETRGMVIHTAVPLRDRRGRPAGVLEGGMLLNQNLDFIDSLNDLVYRPDSLPEGSHGTATLFLDDVRIATNVRLFEGRRALGTRISGAVRERVLGRGGTWLDRAFVVKDWYVSGYQPLHDSRGERVGMLYVGYLEKPFRDAKLAALAAILLLFAAMGAGAGVLFWRWARTIFQPLERMDATITAVEAGRLDARTGEVGSANEIGRVAGHLDQLLDLQEQRNHELKVWGDELDRKVAERTAELSEANRLLQETQRQLVMSEKLAAIGEITSGVAHEINNPVAVMQGNLDLMRELLGPAAEPVREEIRLLDEQIRRIQVLVNKLLQFARPSDYAGYVETVAVTPLLDDCLLLVRHLLSKGDIAVLRDSQASRTVGINRTELQQVLINLLVNAIHAMPDGGTLTLATRDWEDKGVAITVSDTGTGIPREHLARIFDPFFTTKQDKGTGLGLSISYTIVARYGGSITVESEPGQGSAFTVWLLSEPDFGGVG